MKKVKPIPLKNYLLYARTDKETFKKKYDQVKELMQEENQSLLATFSLIAAVIFVLLFGASFPAAGLEKYRLLYGVMCVISAVVWWFNFHRVYKSMMAVRAVVYFYVFSILTFSILIGTVYSPNELATVYNVLLIAATLLFTDRPIYFSAVIFAAYLLFAGLAIKFKDPACLTSDLTNATAMLVFALVSCVYFMNLKFQKMFLEYADRVASETDFLTGLKNRKRFEMDLHAVPTDHLKDTYFVYADANGLHRLNDEKGHDAGDEMLKFIAEAFRRAFGDDTYRIGGDEFVTFGSKLTCGEVEEICRRLDREITEAGYSISIGFDVGINIHSVNELMKFAEKKMYLSKNEYYQATGIDRRRHV